jgi:hypothetical protein
MMGKVVNQHGVSCVAVTAQAIIFIDLLIWGI